MSLGKINKLKKGKLFRKAYRNEMAQGRVGVRTEVVREKPPAARAITTQDNLSEVRRGDRAEPDSFCLLDISLTFSVG